MGPVGNAVRLAMRNPGSGRAPADKEKTKRWLNKHARWDDASSMNCEISLKIHKILGLESATGE